MSCFMENLFIVLIHPLLPSVRYPYAGETCDELAETYWVYVFKVSEGVMGGRGEGVNVHTLHDFLMGCLSCLNWLMSLFQLHRL